MAVPLTLTINGDNYLPMTKRGSVKITEQLQNHANTMSLEVVVHADDALGRPQEGSVVVHADTSVSNPRTLFGGYVIRTQPRYELGIGSQILYDVECVDRTWPLITHNAQEICRNMTLYDIVELLNDTYLSSYAIDITNVDVGPTITGIQFNQISIRQAFEKLTSYTGYDWWIDYDNNLYFKPRGYTSAPEMFTDSTGNHSRVDISIDAAQVHNSVLVSGGLEETSGYQEDIFVGNGQTRSWSLTYKPRTMQEVKIDPNTGTYGAALNVGVDPLNNDTEIATPGTYDYMFNYQEKFLRNEATEATLAANYKIRARYTYDTRINYKIQSATSISILAALEGGDGIHDFYINDPSIASSQEAIQRAVDELEQYGMPLVECHIETRTGLLAASTAAQTYFRPGQMVSIQFDSWGITAPIQYLLQEITTTYTDDGTDIEYQYDIRIGGRRITTAFLLEKLLTNEEPLDDSVDQLKIQLVQEQVGVSETISRLTDRAVAETCGVSETITATIVTPPYNWSPTGTKPAYWNEFGWG